MVTTFYTLGMDFISHFKKLKRAKMNDQSWLFSELGNQSHESFFFLLVHKLILITRLQGNVPKLF